MIDAVTITRDTTIVEIGCGDGFLTRTILHHTRCKALHIFEIDPEWAGFVQEKYGKTDPGSSPGRKSALHMHLIDIMEVDLETLRQPQPLILLANLPYQITFPLFEKFVQHFDLFDEAVVMVQEEAAQKMVSTAKRSYNAMSLYLQHSFDFKLLEKVEPEAFIPPPKVTSRLVYFKPKKERVVIPDEAAFWLFVRACFKTPRQTLRNNLKRTHYAFERLGDEALGLRAQQTTFDNLLGMWEVIRKPS
jgi:16S rRNA (adenine1518-N6/adenine1519-N6)-dimethyltransferase